MKREKEKKLTRWLMKLQAKSLSVLSVSCEASAVMKSRTSPTWNMKVTWPLPSSMIEWATADCVLNLFFFLSSSTSWVWLERRWRGFFFSLSTCTSFCFSLVFSRVLLVKEYEIGTDRKKKYQVEANSRRKNIKRVPATDNRLIGMSHSPRPRSPFFFSLSFLSPTCLSLQLKTKFCLRSLTFFLFFMQNGFFMSCV